MVAMDERAGFWQVNFVKPRVFQARNAPIQAREMRGRTKRSLEGGFIRINKKATALTTVASGEGKRVLTLFKTAQKGGDARDNASATDAQDWEQS
jgi:hypothetical protein